MKVTMNLKAMNLTMKALFLMVLVTLVGLLGLKDSKACSVQIVQDIEKDNMRQALATHYGLPLNAIQRTDLTRVGFSFLAGLEADCSGLEEAVISSAFSFSAVKNFKKCTYKGVILQKNSAPVGEYFINDESPVCVPHLIPIPRLPIDLSIRR